MANLSNINNKLLVGTNGEVRIGDTATVADVKLRIKQLDNQWPMQIVSNYAYGLSIDTSLGTDGNAGSLQIYPNSGGGFIVRNDSKVGIGTNSPSYKLVVGGDVDYSSGIGTTNAIFVQDANYPAVVVGVDNQNYGYIKWNVSGGYLSIATKENYANQDNTLVLKGGNVGIGTVSPDGKLDVAQNMTAGTTTAFTSPHLSLTALNATDNTGFVGMTFATSDNVNYGWSWGALRTNGGLGDMVLRNHYNSAQGTERMRISSGGNILANKTVTGQVLTDGFEYSTDNYLSICNSVSSNYSLYVANKGASGTRNMVAFFGTSSIVGSITYNGTVTAYNTTSDYRLKEDLKDFNGLDKVSKISVYDFKWKSEESRSYGVMAHELEEVLPDAVSGEKDAEENQMVDYSKIVPLLVKSIQELKAEIELLKSK
jgi:hypothetical protein